MIERFLALPVTQHLTRTITLRQMEQIPIVVVDHPTSCAAISIQGAQLLQWQPAGEQPVLWLSDRTAWAEGVPIRGGVPICWPWFGAQGEPGHGFARTSMWQLTSLEDQDNSVLLTLTLDSTPQTRALWPHDFTLTCRIRLGRECAVEIEAATDRHSTAALHTYLNVGAADATEVSGLGTDYLDKVLDNAPSRQDGPLTPIGHIDRIYTTPDAVSVITDRRIGRTIQVRHREHSDVVVWNPGPQLSESVSDLTEDAYHRFICVETARITQPLEGATLDRAAYLATELSASHFG